MSASALLSELRRRDIHLRAEGDELRLSAPAGVLTVELREALRRYKGDLLVLLGSAQALAGQERAVVPLQPHGTRVPVFAVAGHNGDVFCYRVLAQCLGEGQPFFGLQPPGLDGAEEPLSRVPDLAAYFARQILALQTGECIVAGYCAGGTVAFELARQLAGRGAAVRLLALFGAPYPAYFTRPMQLWLGMRRMGQHLRSASARRGYVAEKLGAYRARRQARRAAAFDPVLARRGKVERSTLEAVRQYRPQPFEGAVALFLPGSEWQRSGVAALRWRTLAPRVQTYFGPEAATGADMLRAPHAAAFAELFRRGYGRVGGSSDDPG